MIRLVSTRWNCWRPGKQDMVVGYTANEPIQLRARGIPVTEIRVADYVQLASNGILASEKVIAGKP